MMEDEEITEVDQGDGAQATASNVAYEGYSSVPEVPEEYVSYGITPNSQTGEWEYQGKRIAVLYDKGICTMANGTSGKTAVYLEVRRDKKGKVEEIKELSKKEMQKLLKSTGFVLE